MVMTSNLANWKQFVLAGKAIFTIQNTVTGNRFTFRVTRHHDSQGHPTKINGQDTWWVSVLSGPDNPNHFTYMGAVIGEEFRTTKRSKVGEDADSFKVFTWLNAYLQSEHPLPEQVTINHEGRCGRCGRRLTVPESIESGYGPECIHLIGKGYDHD
jgi:hypothetical protein